MKKIIAAALSILVGAFGYNIVDKAIEDRVTSLESEVVELREEISRYHPQYSEQVTTAPVSESTTRSKETTNVQNTTNTKNTTRKQATTTGFISNTWFTESLTVPMVVGDFLIEDLVSIHKYLIQEGLNGRYQYVPADKYISVPLHSQLPDGVTCGSDVVSEKYVYITESSAQLTDISEKVSYSYYYDKDYSQNSTACTERATSIKVKCKGYTDPSLEGENVVFYINWSGNSRPDTIISNTIKADGTFEYEAIYSCKYELMNYQAYYGFTSISVS